MQAFEHRLFGIRGCDKTFVTAPYCCTFNLQYFLIPPEYYFL
ncbi:hypothetical protein A5834_002566, partial [Enterococcus faecium]